MTAHQLVVDLEIVVVLGESEYLSGVAAHKPVVVIDEDGPDSGVQKRGVERVQVHFEGLRVVLGPDYDEAIFAPGVDLGLDLEQRVDGESVSLERLEMGRLLEDHELAVTGSHHRVSVEVVEDNAGQSQVQNTVGFHAAEHTVALCGVPELVVFDSHGHELAVALHIHTHDHVSPALEGALDHVRLHLQHRDIMVVVDCARHQHTPRRTEC